MSNESKRTPDIDPADMDKYQVSDTSLHLCILH